MRPSVVVLVVSVGAGVLLAAFLLRKPTDEPKTQPDSYLPPESDQTASEVSTRAKPAAKPGRPAVTVVTNLPADASGEPAESPEDRQQAYVQTRSSELMDLAMNDDADSMRTILSELTNRDPEIRKAAVQAAVQFGSRDAIPALMDAATQTDDAHEKAAIQEAIEFLELPSLAEVREQRKATEQSAPAFPAETSPSR